VSPPCSPEKAHDFGRFFGSFVTAGLLRLKPPVEETALDLLIAGAGAPKRARGTGAVPRDEPFQDARPLERCRAFFLEPVQDLARSDLVTDLKQDGDEWIAHAEVIAGTEIDHRSEVARGPSELTRREERGRELQTRANIGPGEDVVPELSAVLLEE
jgi:hypothetical protein